MVSRKSAALGDLLKDALKKLASPSKPSIEAMLAIWEEAVGGAGAKHSRPVAIRKSELIVNVDGSSWLYELTLKKKDILKNMEGKLGKKSLSNIRYRIGEIKENG